MDWDKAFEDQAKASASVTLNVKRMKEKSEAEFQKGVRLGWWDEHGNSLLAEDQDDENDGEAV